MLLDEKLIIRDEKLLKRDDVFESIAVALEKAGKQVDKKQLIGKFIERENQVSTGFEMGIAIPHAQISGITEPIIVIAKTGEINWPSLDKKPTNLIIAIIVPTDGGNKHLSILSQLSRNIVVDEFRNTLFNGTDKQILLAINTIEKKDEVKEKKDIFYVGVTKCPVGIAHTYMAAEKLEKTAKELGVEIKVETQGSQGIENKLTDEDVRRASGVIVAADVAIEGKERFNGKKYLEVPIKRTLKDTELLFDEVEKANVITVKDQGKITEQPQKGAIIKYILNGVSHMIPFVVVGGLLIAVSLSLGGEPTETGIVIPPDSFWFKINQIGSLGFLLMIPIFSGFIAFAISGRAALAPAMIGAMIANDPAILGTEAGAGFFGAIIVGILVGFMVKYMNTWNVPKSLRAIMPIFVIPILGTLIVGVLFIFVLGQPLSMIMIGFENVLVAMSTNPYMSIPLGFLLGAMLAFDMGGPINKIAFLFGVTSIASGTPEIMGAVACAGAVPPLATGLASLIGPKKFTKDEKGAGYAAILMGAIGISEGAIPFAAGDPKRVIPSIMIGSGVAGALGMFFKITCMVPHTGPIVGALNAINFVGLFFVCIAAGTAVSIALILVLKKDLKFDN